MLLEILYLQLLLTCLCKKIIKACLFFKALICDKLHAVLKLE